MAAQRLAGICASFVLTLAGFALVAWWLMWPVWSRPPPALLPPPLSLLLLSLAALSLLARARGRPSGWSSAPALLLIVLAAVLLLEAGADLHSGLARLLSPAAVRPAHFALWRPSLLLAGQSILVGTALWSVHGRRGPGFDLGDGLAAIALALAVALVVREPGGAAFSAVLLAGSVLLLDTGRGLPALLRRARLPRRRARAEPAPQQPAAAPAEAA
ncbi:MAG TPA: hypothetical protein VM074_08095, partial [Solimonas sp.]|nr:hypothetical protein [Solimonas sp.]